jgi:hypothetical protein
MDPVTDRPAGMLQRFKPLPVDALLFEGSDHPFHRSVLLRVVRRDELFCCP